MYPIFQPIELRRLPHAVSVLGLFCLLAFNNVNAAENEKLLIKGSTTIMPIALSIGAEFEQENPGVKVQVSGNGSVEGIRELLQGAADIATSSTFIPDPELQLARERDIYPVPFRIGYDCILPVVHRANPVDNLSLSQLKNIYLGQISNWRQLGGPDRKIQVISRDTASGTHDVWHHLVMNQANSISSIPLKHASSDVVSAVAEEPDAIGYISLAYLNARVKPLRVNGIMGSSRSLRDGSYPISRPLFMFTNGWPRGKTLKYINFVLNPRGGQALIEEAGYIPLNY